MQAYLPYMEIPLPGEIQRALARGCWYEAEDLIRKALRSALPKALRLRLEAELEVLRRLPLFFSYSREELALELGLELPALDGALEQLEEQGLLCWTQSAEGPRFASYTGLQLRSLLDGSMAREREAELAQREALIARMKAEGGAHYRFSVRVEMQLRNAFLSEGTALRVELPVPVEYAQCERVRVNRFWPKAVKERLAGPEEPCRSLSMVAIHRAQQSYGLEYSFETRQPYADYYGMAGRLEQEAGEARDAHVHGLKEAAYRKFLQVFHRKEKHLTPSAVAQTDEELESWLLEAEPHIHFTPLLYALASEIIGDEQIPLMQARKLYSYVCRHTRYQLMPPYFLVSDLTQYTALERKGDCGAQSLLFITLCRICGIPARWQGGQYIADGSCRPHDWAQFYVRPYGWLYADCAFGGSAWAQGDSEQFEFYFGNIDPMRIPLCAEFQSDFVTESKCWRNDPYDNQQGEVFCGGRCLLDNEMETNYELLECSSLPWQPAAYGEEENDGLE